jgi:hypothetical protein
MVAGGLFTRPLSALWPDLSDRADDERRRQRTEVMMCGGEIRQRMGAKTCGRQILVENWSRWLDMPKGS